MTWLAITTIKKKTIEKNIYLNFSLKSHCTEAKKRAVFVGTTAKNKHWRNKVFAGNVLMLILLQIEINSITINENICQQQPRIAQM